MLRAIANVIRRSSNPSRCKPLSKEQALRALKIAEANGLVGFGGMCGLVAIAINEVLFCGRGMYVVAMNDFLWERYSQIAGHVVVKYKKEFWDSEGVKDWEDVESWGMLDPDDPDYSFDSDDEAENVGAYEFSADELREYFGHLCPATDPRLALIEARSRVEQRAFNPELLLVRSGSRWLDANEGVVTLRRPGHLYRGMTHAEYDNTVGARLGVQSTNAWSLPGEGTSLADDIEVAEDYANTGSTDPRKTGLSTYLVEVDPEGLPFVERNRQGYYWAHDTIPQDRVTRAWEMRARGDDIIAVQIL